ncbi:MULTISPECIES: queuosine precursor transporter [Hyphobacterium]|uniref:Probable queuosine precursor transporter n=1 Tax=Hyphobacterium vulgare TaxID=1736751 RepID=A0ABV6ZV05_9PROT
MSERPSNADLPVLPEPGRAAFVFIFCVSLFIACLISAAVLAVKPIAFNLFGFGLLVPVGTFAFALTFTATDVISEVWGRKMATHVVISGLIIRLVVFGLFAMGLTIETWVPWVGPADYWTAENEAAFEFVLASSNRTNIAGMAAFGLSALTDVFIYHYLRERDRGKNRLWWRNNVSTIIAQIVNSVIFITVAFGGVVSLAALFSLILGQVAFKILTAGLDTPLVYILRNFATGRKLLDFRG